MYGCICYLLKYLCKPERNISKLMQEAMLSENNNKKVLNKMKNLWMHHREMCYTEAVLQLNSEPLLRKTRDSAFIPAMFPEQR